MSKFHKMSDYPLLAAPLVASSGNVAAATAAATLTSSGGGHVYLAGFNITGTGATAGLPVAVTVTGIAGGTLTYAYAAAVGALVANQPLNVSFNPPIPASSSGVNIVVSCPTLGIGNTNNTANAYGYQLLP